MRFVSALVACALVAACSKPGGSQGGQASAARPATAENVGAPAGSPAGAPASGTITGKVLERIDASSYSYLRLETATGESWAAVPQTQLDKGAQVTVVNAVPMDGFESQTLKRKFDKIWFGSLPGAGAMAGVAPASAGANPHGAVGPTAPAAGASPGHPTAPASAVGDVKVAKAAGPDARTVAEVWSQKALLKDKAVAVKGKVVKFTSGVMGKNWVHLRDGSGTQEKADNDVTVTTSAEAAVGDVVTARGKVTLDRDFGSGYSYSVLVEDATISK